MTGIALFPTTSRVRRHFLLRVFDRNSKLGTLVYLYTCTLYSILYGVGPSILSFRQCSVYSRQSQFIRLIEPRLLLGELGISIA